MYVDNFIKNPDYQSFKQFVIDSLVYTPLEIDTTNKTDAQIAVEVRASQMAIEKIKKVIKEFESQVQKEIVQQKPYV